MIIAVPSKGRPDRVTTLSVIPDATLFVPENERSAYEKLNPGTTVVPVPNDVIGITRTRNWILENTDPGYLVFIDDDVETAGWTELLPHNGRQHRLSGNTWTETFWRLFDLTEQSHFRLWGIKTEAALRSTYPYKPFLFQSYATASCMGLLNFETPAGPPLRFDESFPVKEDYEITLRAIQEDGGIIAARYLHWQNSHWADDGGCKDYRTGEMEAAAIRRLIELYPAFIRRVRRVGTKYTIQLDF